ncbi:MAG TPA: hypothetical protein DHW39_05895 [Erysipelotrichaceae bacterium]|nr:hypothetical protein [Erysipelotrichaceae bacterium]
MKKTILTAAVLLAMTGCTSEQQLELPEVSYNKAEIIQDETYTTNNLYAISALKDTLTGKPASSAHSDTDQLYGIVLSDDAGKKQELSVCGTAGSYTIRWNENDYALSDEAFQSLEEQIGYIREDNLPLIHDKKTYDLSFPEYSYSDVLDICDNQILIRHVIYSYDPVIGDEVYETPALGIFNISTGEYTKLMDLPSGITADKAAYNGKMILYADASGGVCTVHLTDGINDQIIDQYRPLNSIYSYTLRRFGNQVYYIAEEYDEKTSVCRSALKQFDFEKKELTALHEEQITVREGKEGELYLRDPIAPSITRSDNRLVYITLSEPVKSDIHILDTEKMKEEVISDNRMVTDAIVMKNYMMLSSTEYHDEGDLMLAEETHVIKNVKDGTERTVGKGDSKTILHQAYGSADRQESEITA